MNIRLYSKYISFFSTRALLCNWFSGFFENHLNKKYSAFSQWAVVILGAGTSFLSMMFYHEAHSTQVTTEPVEACVIARDVELTDAIRAKFAQCLGWKSDESSPICLGDYQPIIVEPLASPEEVRVHADGVSFYQDKPSTLTGHVQIQQNLRIVNAQTAYVYRDSKTNKVNKIELLGEVRYLEPDRLMIARKAIINPEDNSGQTEDVLYRFNSERRTALLPAWGRASLIQRFANNEYLLRKATYTTCAPQDKAWDIQADSIVFDNAHGKAIARNAKIRIRERTVLYTPYLSFPTNKERKSGFLLPIVGYSNIGGLDFGTPYYWNIAPNYDLTFIPHIYSERGVMLGSEYRFLTSKSNGIIRGNFLPDDRAYKNFLLNNGVQFPSLSGKSTNRWSVGVQERTRFTPALQLNVNVQQVSDDYYLQDFSANLALLTQRQLLRQIDLLYSTENWIFRGMGQSYQTLHPINESPISDVYERLPQFMARGYYYDLPMNANLNILGQYDQFHWPENQWLTNPLPRPQGPRFHLNPILSMPHMKPWGYITPAVQFVENYYEVQNNWNYKSSDFNRTIPRFSVDSGLFFERDLNLMGGTFTQTLEPRLFYLKVPYQDQSAIPVYDSGNMIFNVDQLFRTNRFSGFDRISDANQLSYALTSRWLSEETGAERANISVGQIKYFANRQVQLCQSISGHCIDNPNTFGALSSVSGTSPVASRAVYHFNPVWGITGDYIWDPVNKATNNADLNLHYQPDTNQIITFGYSYLVNGDMTQVRQMGTEDNALHQATLAVAWPLTDKWSTVGAYTHNISKNYSMMTLVGLQYDNCCWAIRALGGRTFQSLGANFEPRYNNNVYLQILLKGLGSVSNNDPSNLISTYLPGYKDQF